MKGTPSLKRCLQALYQTLMTKTDPEGRILSEMFRRKPSAKMYPEYYIVVKKPIDLKEISAKIKSEQVLIQCVWMCFSRLQFHIHKEFHNIFLHSQCTT